MSLDIKYINFLEDKIETEYWKRIYEYSKKIRKIFQSNNKLLKV